MPVQELPVSHGSPLDAKELVKQAVDIVELVGHYLPLRRQGRKFVGLCPWHDDRKPSLEVNPERQSFKCWVCDIGGDVFDFVMRMDGLTFPEALNTLAEKAHVDLTPYRRQRSGPPAGGIDKQTLLKAVAWAERQYHECFLHAPEAEAARQYIAGRGISPASIEKFHLGFAPMTRDWLAERAGRNENRLKVLEAAGILVAGADSGFYDRFRGRVLFSIRDFQGRPVGFGGRLLPESNLQSPAKYVNTPETPLFLKHTLAYGLDVAKDPIRRARTALVMEGYTDVIVAHQYGFDNAVAVLGTALGEGHIKLLKRFCDRFVLVLDGDEAGQKRTNEVLELFVARQIDLRVLTLPEGLDPCDFLHQRGAEALQHLLDHEAIDALDHAFRTATRGLDVERDVHGATQALERLIAIIAKAPRPAGEERFREEKVLQRLSAHFRVAENEVRQRLAALRRKGPSGAASIAPATTPASGQTTGDATTDASVPAKLDPWRRELFELLVAHPKFWTIVRREISQEWLTAGPSRLIYETSCRISGEGGEATFERLMLVLEDSAARSLLVELDEGWREKGPRGEPEQLLRALIRNFQLKEASKQRPAQLVALREGRLDDSQTIALLQSMLEQQRKRQNMTDPTDG